VTTTDSKPGPDLVRERTELGLPKAAPREGLNCEQQLYEVQVLQQSGQSAIILPRIAAWVNKKCLKVIAVVMHLRPAGKISSTPPPPQRP